MTAYLVYCLVVKVRSMTIAQGRQVSECPDAWQKEVSPASYRGESRQASDLFPNGPFGDGHIKRAVLGPEDGIALVPQLMKIRIIRPHIHRKLKLADKACATDERGDSSLDSVFGCALRQRRTVRPSAPDHLPPFIFTAVSRGFMRRMCAPSGQAYPLGSMSA